MCWVVNSIAEIENYKDITSEPYTDVLGKPVYRGDYVAVTHGKSFVFGMYIGERYDNAMIASCMTNGMYQIRKVSKQGIIRIGAVDIPSRYRKRNSELEDYLWLSKKLEMLRIN